MSIFRCATKASINAAVENNKNKKDSDVSKYLGKFRGRASVAHLEISGADLQIGEVFVLQLPNYKSCMKLYGPQDEALSREIQSCISKNELKQPQNKPQKKKTDDSQEKRSWINEENAEKECTRLSNTIMNIFVRATCKRNGVVYLADTSNPAKKSVPFESSELKKAAIMDFYDKPSVDIWIWEENKDKEKKQKRNKK